MSHFIRILLTTLLFFLPQYSSDAAKPSWILMGELKDTYFYIDAANITHNNSSVSFWTLMDYKGDIHKDGSVMTFQTIYCTKNTNTSLRVMSFADHMATGGITWQKTYESNEIIEDPIVPGSFIDDVKDKLCK